eukprot:gene20545-biopygen21181
MTSNSDSLQQSPESSLPAPSLEREAPSEDPGAVLCKAKTRGAPDLELADRRVRRTRAIIEYYDPAYFFIENPAGDALRGMHTRAVMKGLPEPLLTTYSQAVYAIPRALLHHLFCELKFGERMKEENALAVMDLISTLTARKDEHESENQDTEAN